MTFISTGGVLAETVKAAELLAAGGVEAGVVSLPTIQPLDIDAILKAASESRRIITVEEHIGIGGLGEAVAAVVGADGAHCRLRQASITPTPSGTAGSQATMRKRYGLDAFGLTHLASSFLRECP